MVHQEHNLDWFPRMRAMSLVSSDGEGEQNEIRNLQEKLESTMRLVANLSGQLTELKEQVWTTPSQLLLNCICGQSSHALVNLIFGPPQKALIRSSSSIVPSLA